MVGKVHKKKFHFSRFYGKSSHRQAFANVSGHRKHLLADQEEEGQRHSLENWGIVWWSCKSKISFSSSSWFISEILFQLFEKLREAVPKFRHKIVTIAGDCSVAGLGLSLIDRQTLVSSIGIIFHAAATIKFDESLKLAVDINVHGTKDVIELAKEMKNLKVIDFDGVVVEGSGLAHTLLCDFSPSYMCQQLTPIAI